METTDADDPRHRRPGIQQMGDIVPGNFARFARDARLEDSGISAETIADLVLRIELLEARLPRRKP